MGRRVIPESPEAKFKRKARVTTAATNLTRTEIDIVPDDPTQPTREGNVREFLDQALQRFKIAADAEFYNRTEGLQDALMVDGERQWDEDVRCRRKRKKRPCLTLNRFIPMIAHVANEHRMSKVGIDIKPVGGGADVQSAEIRQGLIRHIEVISCADTVYDTAFERMIEKGWSWFRVVTDWESDTSFHQVVRIEGFTNDFAVYSDPSAEDPTRKDMKFGFIVRDVPRGEYLTQYPKSKAAGLTSFASIGDDKMGWLTPDSVRICEYYYMDEEPAIAVRLADGEGVWRDEIEERDGLWYNALQLKAMDEGLLQPEMVLPIPVDQDRDGNLITRESVRMRPKWAKINAVEILDGDQGSDFTKSTAGRDIPGKFIPLIHVAGRERVVEGQRRLSGMVRNNRDAQRIYNYMASGFVEMVALAPKSPFIAAIGQIEEFKPLWDSLNEENWPYLPYKPKDVSGQLVPPPIRQDNRIAESAIGYLQGLREFDNIIKIGFNIFDPSLGVPKADQSGRAVAALQARSDSANYNWLDNMNRARVHAGEVILHMLPVVYDAARIVTIVRPDNERQEIAINQEFPDPKTGKAVNYDMSVGKYSVTVSIGQYASKREKAVAALTDIAKNVPQVAIALLPMILENMDAPMAEEAAAIVKRLQPPELQEPGSPEAMQAQFASLMQQHQLLIQALERANRLIETDVLDSETKKEVASIQARAQMAVAMAKLGSADGIARLNAEYKSIQADADRIHDQIVGALDRKHEKEVVQMKPAPTSKK